jgi:hypothetical protein
MANIFNEQAPQSRIQPFSDAAHLAASNMELYGGTFAARIGQAYFAADRANSITLIEAFRPLFEKFAAQGGRS